jgi:hypothetical protein
MHRFVFLIFLIAFPLAAQMTYEQRVELVRRTPGFVALWDFVKRVPDGRFAAHQAPRERHDLTLDAGNYVRDFWNEGPEATYADFPLLPEGPFGQSVQYRDETNPNFRPVLLVPRARMHNSGLDAKGRGRSVSMAIWVRRASGGHALGGIWHEGTDLAANSKQAARVETGKRQYALFAGLAANPGASAAHVSENGNRSFGDKYARNLATTPEVLPAGWALAAFSFDNRANTVTAYLDGRATEYWIDEPEKHPFFQWPARGWRQAELRQTPGVQEGEDAAFPASQFYRPPEKKPISKTRINATTELLVYPFTKVRVIRDAKGNIIRRELAALRVNPFWFPHDLYSPSTPEEGGPFTIGRVIHSSRSVGFTGAIGGVAVFNRALKAREMERLAAIRADLPAAGR